MDKLAILIPCYNEALTVKKVVEDCKKYAKAYDTKIYVYDNNSSDDTARIAEEAGAIVRHEYKQGKGNVIRRMFREIDAECYVMLDGDDTYPPEYIDEMAALVLEKGTDMVVGDRLSSSYYTENKRPFHNFGNKIVKRFINLFFKSNIKDIMTGYRAFSYEFVKTFPVLSKGFEIETEMSIHTIDKNMHVENVVIDYRDRPEGSESKLNTYSDGFKVLRTIFTLYRNYMPFRFFSIVSCILCVLAVAVFIPVVLVPYIRTGLVANFPTLIVCGFVAIAAMLSFYVGMILDSITQKDRQEFEYRLQQASSEKVRKLGK
ncbi:glycosyltransferase [Eubacteriales bacterium OttesenSCG-928-M02]|nr:glycosyltransferase [Eubacteriales bacterium OttesenSCG-928-M02]